MTLLTDFVGPRKVINIEKADLPVVGAFSHVLSACSEENGGWALRCVKTEGPPATEEPPEGSPALIHMDKVHLTVTVGLSLVMPC